MLESAGSCVAVQMPLDSLALRRQKRCRPLCHVSATKTWHLTSEMLKYAQCDSWIVFGSVCCGKQCCRSCFACFLLLDHDKLVQTERSTSGSSTPLLEPEDEDAKSETLHPATLRHVPGELNFQRRRPIFKIQHLIFYRHSLLSVSESHDSRFLFKKDCPYSAALSLCA